MIRAFKVFDKEADGHISLGDFHSIFESTDSSLAPIDLRKEAKK